jgi:hypothetical protein
LSILVLSSSTCPPVLASARRSQFDIPLNLEILLVKTIKSTILGVLQNQEHIRTLTQIWETQQSTHRVPCTLEIKTTIIFTFLLRPPLHHPSHTTVRARDQWKAT